MSARAWRRVMVTVVAMAMAAAATAAATAQGSSRRAHHGDGCGAVGSVGADQGGLDGGSRLNLRFSREKLPALGRFNLVTLQPHEIMGDCVAWPAGDAIS